MQASPFLRAVTGPARVSSLSFAAALILSGATLSAAAPSDKSGGPLQNAETRTVIRSLPFKIQTPGSYLLGASLTCPDADADGITIDCPDVTLDLGGFTLTGRNSGAPSGKARGIVKGISAGGVCVRNGALVGWGGDGVHCAGDADITCQDLRITGCGGHGVCLAGGELRNVTCENNKKSGVCTLPPLNASALPTELLLTDCVIQDNGHDAVTHKRPGKAKYKNIVLKRCAGNGISVPGAGAGEAFKLDLELENVSVSDNGRNGVSCCPDSSSFQVRCRMERCHIDDNKGHGLDASSKAAGFFECWPCRSSFSGNGGDGIRIDLTGPRSSMSVTVDSCQALRNAGQGCLIACSGEGSRANARCEDSEFNDNGATGATIDTRMRTVGPKADCIACFRSCFATGNGGHGLVVAHEAAHVVQSRCTGNAGDGVRIEDCDNADLSEVDCVNNGGTGFRIRCVNAVCRQLTASSNDGGGVDEDCDGTAELDQVCSTGNRGDGTAVRAKVSLSMDRCSARSNGGVGISGDSYEVNADRCVSSNNGADGFDLTARGALQLSNSQGSKNKGSACTMVCASGWSRSNFLTGNTGAGLDLTASDGASVTDNVITGNGKGGIVYVGSYGDVSNNRCSSNTGDAISVDGEHNRIASNVVTNNDRGFSLKSGVNPLYENTGGANTNPMHEDVPNDRAPDSPVSKATHPFSNIEAP